MSGSGYADLGVAVVEVQIGEGEVEAYAFEEFEERVADGRIPSSARIRFEPVTGDVFRDAADLDLFTSIREGSAVAWQVRFRNSGPPLLTALLVGVQIRIWLWAQVPETASILVKGGVNWMSPTLENGEPWRLLSYGLLHTDFLHILLNMVWMTYTGWNIERALGRFNLAAIFFFSVFFGGLLSMFFTPGVPSLGASGGVFGLVSASVVFGFIRQDLLPEKGRRLFGAALAPYLVLMFLSGLSNASTDNWAHFGGLVMGAFLAVVLDPPGFERRPNQNRLVNLSGAVLIAFVMGGLAIGGPSIYPLVDKEQARIDALPAASRARVLQRTGLMLTDLSWAVPAGWKTGTNAAGDAGFVSPVRGQDRSFVVLQMEEERPVDVDEVLGAWREKVLRGHPDAVFDEAPGEDWLGRPRAEVRQARVRLPSGRILEWKGATRGVYALYRVLEFEEDMEGRLAPLFERLDASVAWSEPLELQAARRNVLATPRGVKARTALAVALAKWGEEDESLPIFASLVRERPEDPERWVRWLRYSSWFPERPDANEAVERALRENPMPEVLVEISHGLRERGEVEAANGVLQLGWIQRSGDRKLKRALRKANLRWALSPSGLPTQFVFLPDGTERADPSIDTLQNLPITLEAASLWGRRLMEERVAIADSFVEANRRGEGVPLLLRVRDGGFQPIFDEQHALRRELLAASEGRPAEWMVGSLPEALNEEVVEALRRSLAPEEE